MTQTVDEAKLGEFMGQMVGYMTGGAMCFGVWLGDELGLYRVLDRHRPGDRRRGGRQGRLQPPADPRVARRPGRRRPRRLGRDRPTATSSRPKPCWRWPTTTRRRSSPAG